MNGPRVFSFWTIFCAGVLAAQGFAADGPTPAQVAELERHFEQKVRPLLAAHCLECHGPTKQESGIRFDSRASILKGGDSGKPGLVPGKPDESLVLKAVRHEGDLKMPPEKKLSAEEIEALANWIKAGAVWPAGATNVAVLSVAERADANRRDHWAFRPIARPPLPAVRDKAWPSSPLDVYLLAKLEQASLPPSTPADRHTLLRRLSFDLLGLPIDAAENDEFVADDAPDALARLVDRLLASPHFGERWGRHWLDVARYADSKGYAFAKERRYPYAYTYRDYVVEAFNADVPYDRFVVEQLAADFTATGDDKRSLAALGFLTTGRKFNNAHDDIDDKIDVVSRGLLGLTVSCARCHDHKYDAVAMDDYYSLYGVFASVHEPENLPLIGSTSQNADYAKYEAELGKLQQELEAFRQKKRAELIEQARQRATDYLARVASTQPDDVLAKIPFLSIGKGDLRPKLVERWRNWLTAQAKPDHPVLGAWHELIVAVDANLKDDAYAARAKEALEKLLARPEGTAPGQLNPTLKAALAAEPATNRVEVARAFGKAWQTALTAWKQQGGNAEALGKLAPGDRQLVELLTAAESPTEIPADQLKDVLNRADRNEQGEFEKKIERFQATAPGAPPRAMIVAENAQPHNPHIFLRGNPGRAGKQVPRQFLLVVAGPQRQPFQRGSGRLELAQAITSPDNPLTRRVLVNRVWMQHFGEPLVSTPSDFGIRTERPPQHDVLDYLASYLTEHDWSLKALHRELILSSVYRQSSVDRDEARAIDPENRLLWRMNRRRLDFEPLRDSLLSVADNLDLSIGGKPVDLFNADPARRRAVYGYVDRQDLPNLLRVFDFASPDQSSEKRPRTTVPQQALFLMNSPLVSQQARRLLARPEVSSTADPQARITALYRIVFGRAPSAEELQVGVEFAAAPVVGDAPPAQFGPWEQYAQLLLLTNEFAYVD